MLRKKTHSTPGGGSGSFDPPYVSEEEGGNYNLNASTSSDNYGYLSRSVSHGSQHSYDNTYGNYGAHPYYSNPNNGNGNHTYQTPVKASSSSSHLVSTPSISNKSASRSLGNILPSFQSTPTLKRSHHSSASIRKSSRDHRSSCTRICFTCLLVCILLLIALVLLNLGWIPLSLLGPFHHLPSTISSTLFRPDKNDGSEVQQKVMDLEQEILLKQNTIQDLTTQLSYLRANSNIDTMKRREDVLQNRLNQLYESIAHESRQRVIEHYGSDTIRVTLFLEVPWDTPDLSPVSFTVEMHSVDYMPHSVLTFLEQVEHGLWDNTYFMTNAPHILLSSTVQDVKSKPFNFSHLSAFQDVGLDHLLFQEYHDHYPHKSMTLGFAGRPAGPNFYINKIDNAVIHGPGGQAHHDIDEEADPCFATVVGGKEILMRIFALPVQQGDSYELFRPVKITRAFVHPKAEMENHES